jgi:general secretion pathway protein B
MSYILDALKRADAERERGHVPGLHSQSASALASGPTRAPRKRTAPVLLAGAAILLLTMAAAVWWWRSAPVGEPDPAAAVQPPVAAPAPSVAAPPAAIVETPATPAAPALPILAPPPMPAPATASGPDTPGAVDATQPGASSTATPTAPNTAPSQGNTQNAANPPTPAASGPSSGPPVQISGVTYSENRSHRMLIANGKVVHEGQEIEPGLTVEVISPRSAVLNHRGSRYNINY